MSSLEAVTRESCSDPYPWTPIVFIAATLSLTASICIDQPVRSSVGALVILAGIPFYFLWPRRRPSTRARATLPQ